MVPAAQINPYNMRLMIISAPGDPAGPGYGAEQFPPVQFRQSGSKPAVAFSTSDCAAMFTTPIRRY